MMFSRNKFREFKSNSRASTAVMFAVSVPALIGFAALAVDMGVAYTTEAELQNATDEVALAALVRLRDTKQSFRVGFTEAQLTQDIVTFAKTNVPVQAGAEAIEAGDIEYGVWDFNTESFAPTSTMTAVNAVRVQGHMTAARDNALPTYFGAMFRDHFDISVSSMAVLPVPPGFHALSANAASAVYITDSDLDISDMVINSTHSDALTTFTPPGENNNWGFGGIDVHVAGGARVIGSTLQSWDKVSTGQHGVRDFMEHHTQPSVGGCDYTRYQPRPLSNRIVLKPGTYCGLYVFQRVDEVVFEPGDYIIKDSPLFIQDQNQVIAEGVNIFLSGLGASMVLHEIDSVFLRAPETGDQRGITIMSDRNHRRAPIVARISNVGSFTSMGQIYLPKSMLAVQNAHFNGNCVISCVIAERMQFADVLINYFGGISSLSSRAGNPSNLAGIVNPAGLETSFRPYLIQ